MSAHPGDGLPPLFATLPMRLGAALAVLILLGALTAALVPAVVPWVSRAFESTTAGQAAGRQPRESPTRGAVSPASVRPGSPGGDGARPPAGAAHAGGAAFRSSRPAGSNGLHSELVRAPAAA